MHIELRKNVPLTAMAITPCSSTISTESADIGLCGTAFLSACACHYRNENKKCIGEIFTVKIGNITSVLQTHLLFSIMFVSGCLAQI